MRYRIIDAVTGTTIENHETAEAARASMDGWREPSAGDRIIEDREGRIFVETASGPIDFVAIPEPLWPKAPEEYAVYMTAAEVKAEAAKHDAECEEPYCGGCK